MVRRFDPDEVPLCGVRLIEASAGTGKTYNICSLYLRAIREGNHGVEDILVVTFTEAATKELRDRVRARLVEALREEEDPEVRGRVEDAVRNFDEAAIFTIHAFCQRILKENAFESGVLFDVEMDPDAESLVGEAADDFWWGAMARAPQDFVEMVLDDRLTPEVLARIAKEVPRLRDEVTLLPGGPVRDLEDQIEQAEAYRTTYRERKAGLAERYGERREVFRGQIWKSHRDDVEEWLLGGRLFCPEKLAARLPRMEIPSRPFVGALRNLVEEYEEPLRDAFAELKRNLVRQWLVYRDESLRARKERANVQFYSDLLTNLRDALENGLVGEWLARQIRGRFRLAFIDEFQDTDPVQYEIFRRVYTEAPEAGLFLIGDPKQSIYRFRLADIFTYLRAKEVAEECPPLLTNRRSHPVMVRAVNTLFGGVENPFRYEGIPFHPVESVDDKPTFRAGGRDFAGLHIRYLRRDSAGVEPDRIIGKGRAKPLVLEAVAEQIVRLLQMSRDGGCTIGDRPVVPADIAVLTRNNHEAQEMQAVLAQRNVPSVIRDLRSVFDTVEADHLMQALSAILRPSDTRTLRGALLSPLFGEGLAEQQAWEEDPTAYDAVLQRLLDHRLRWEQRGFTAMYRRLLRVERVATRVLARPGGDRRLTNYLHLGELLGQVDLRRGLGPQGLVAWLLDQRGKDVTDESREQRLESDADRLQILTMHRSKGLEFQIVYVPFAWSAMEDRGLEHGFLFHDPGNAHRPTFDLGSPRREQHLAMLREERMAEETRLLYVALTRAVHACGVVWGPINLAEGSGLHPLLHGEKSLRGSGDKTLMDDLHALAARSDGAVTVGKLTQGQSLLDHEAAPEEILAAREARRTLDRAWAIHSFSSIKTDRETDFNLPDHDEEAPQEELPFEDVGEEARFLDFAGGARTGSMVHDVFERIDFTDDRGHGRVIRDRLAFHGFAPSDEEVVADLVRRTLGTPLLEDGFRLAQLANARRMNELEFHFPVRLSDPAALRRWVARPVADHRVEGFLKGFIDLVFEHGGRFYILDYKSNHLGNRLADYAEDRLRAEMRESAYDLQYLLYTVALHRFLRFRLGAEYDYDRHVGGVLYLFLRGLPEAGVFRERPEAVEVEALSRVLGGDA